MYVENHHSQKQLKDLIKKQNNAKMALGLQAILFAKRGKTEKLGD